MAMRWTDRRRAILCAGVTLGKTGRATRREAHLAICEMFDVHGSLAFLRHVADAADDSARAWTRFENEIIRAAREHGAVIEETKR